MLAFNNMFPVYVGLNGTLERLPFCSEDAGLNISLSDQVIPQEMTKKELMSA